MKVSSSKPRSPTRISATSKRSASRCGIKVQAFDYLRYGVLHGTVQKIASDASIDRTTGQLVYDVTIVADDPEHWDSCRATMTVVPGMMVQAEVADGRADDPFLPHRPSMAHAGRRLPRGLIDPHWRTGRSRAASRSPEVARFASVAAARSCSATDAVPSGSLVMVKVRSLKPLTLERAWPIPSAVVVIGPNWLSR